MPSLTAKQIQDLIHQDKSICERASLIDMYGDKVVIGKEFVPETLPSGIIIPKTLQRAETNANEYGYIIGTGPLGEEACHYFGVEDPKDILGRRVWFDKYVGKVIGGALNEGTGENLYEGPVLVLAYADVCCGIELKD